MIKVDKFLGCFALETGGLIIGWLCLIGNMMNFVLCLIGALLLTCFGCRSFNEFIGLFSSNPRDLCDTELGWFRRDLIFLTILIIVTLIAVGLIVIAYFCINAIPNRDHVRVKPMMITMAICTVLAMLRLLSFTVEGFILAAISGAIYGYSFVVLYSLYEMLREEHERDMKVESHQ